VKELYYPSYIFDPSLKNELLSNNKVKPKRHGVEGVLISGSATDG
jgi:hypothetical protein